MRWVHTHGPFSSGHVELKVIDGGHMCPEPIASYWGGVPQEMIDLRGAIIRRLGLVQAEATEPDLWRSREEVVWRRPGDAEAPRP